MSRVHLVAAGMLSAQSRALRYGASLRSAPTQDAFLSSVPSEYRGPSRRLILSRVLSHALSKAEGGRRRLTSSLLHARCLKPRTRNTRPHSATAWDKRPESTKVTTILVLRNLTSKLNCAILIIMQRPSRFEGLERVPYQGRESRWARRSLAQILKTADEGVM